MARVGVMKLKVPPWRIGSLSNSHPTVNGEQTGTKCSFDLLTSCLLFSEWASVLVSKKEQGSSLLI